MAKTKANEREFQGKAISRIVPAGAQKKVSDEIFSCRYDGVALHYPSAGLGEGSWSRG